LASVDVTSVDSQAGHVALGDVEKAHTCLERSYHR
jgi:hypothetical protein